MERITPGPNNEVGVIAALAKAAAQVGAVGKDSMHRGGKAGTFPYRSADSVIAAVAGPLAANELIYIPLVTADQRSTTVIITLAHADGSSITGQVSFDGYVTAGNPKTTGAAMSYALKYFLSSLLMIPFDDPDTELDNHVFTTPTGRPAPQTAAIPAASRPAIEAGPTRALAAVPDPEPELPEEAYADPVDVEAFLRRIQDSSSDIKEAFRVAGTQNTVGSWTFQSWHRWTNLELAAAVAAFDKAVQQIEPDTEPF